jgi:cyanophycinase-like exopeptidase
LSNGAAVQIRGSLRSPGRAAFRTKAFGALEKGFRAAGAAAVEHAAVRPLDEAKRAKFIEQLKNATGVFFPAATKTASWKC